MDGREFQVCRCVHRAVYAHVDLEAIAHNIRLLKAMCKNPDAGNVQGWEMAQCLHYDFIPTVCSVAAIEAMGQLLKTSMNDMTIASAFRTKCSPAAGTVHIKVDTGMSRNGAQPHQVTQLIQATKDNRVPLEGIFTHLANPENSEFSQMQLDSFSHCISPYREDGYLFHVSASAGILYNVGTQYDMIRPGIAAFGVPTDADVADFAAKGFRPSISVKGTPTLVKHCPAGTKVGYGCTYTCQDSEWIATFPFGYDDGMWRRLGGERSNYYVIRDKTGEKCPLVGRVSMDSITVRLPSQPEEEEMFTLIGASFDPVCSVVGIADAVGSIGNEVVVRLSSRLPRVYSTPGRTFTEVSQALGITFECSEY